MIICAGKMGQPTEFVRFEFVGSLDCARFIEFARHRARRLDIGLTVVDCDSSYSALDVSGQRDLIEAFEMALSLGPLQCRIDEIRRVKGPNIRKGHET